VVLANNDTALYLQTGLTAIRPVPNSNAFYNGDTAGELEIFTHFDQLADFFGLTHIVITPDDFGIYDAEQKQWIVRTLTGNRRHQKIYAANDSMVLKIDRGGMAANGSLEQTVGRPLRGLQK
jgi:hypothetical protein